MNLKLIIEFGNYSIYELDGSSYIILDRNDKIVGHEFISYDDAVEYIISKENDRIQDNNVILQNSTPPFKTIKNFKLLKKKYPDFHGDIWVIYRFFGTRREDDIVTICSNEDIARDKVKYGGEQYNIVKQKI